MATSFVSEVLSSPFAFSDFIFGLGFFWQYIQLFGAKNQSDVGSLCKAGPSISTEVSGTVSLLSPLGAAFFLLWLYWSCFPSGVVIHALR